MLSACGREYEAVYSPSTKRSNDGFLGNRIVVRVDQKRRVASVGQSVLDPTHHSGKERIRQIGNDHSDGVRSGCSESGSHGIRDVVECTCSLTDFGHRGWANQVRCPWIKRPGDCRWMKADFLGYVLQGRSHVPHHRRCPRLDARSFVLTGWAGGEHGRWMGDVLGDEGS